MTAFFTGAILGGVVGFLVACIIHSGGDSDGKIY